MCENEKKKYHSIEMTTGSLWKNILLFSLPLMGSQVLEVLFKQKHIAECVRDGRISEEFQCMSAPSDLYDYVRIEQIDALNQEAGLERIKIITPDGPANYMRQVLNSLTEEEFELFIQYHLSTCERQDLIGAAAHTVDILRK